MALCAYCHKPRRLYNRNLCGVCREIPDALATIPMKCSASNNRGLGLAEPTLCLKCLREAIRKETPMVGCYPRPRTADQKENRYETVNGRD